MLTSCNMGKTVKAWSSLRKQRRCQIKKVRLEQTAHHREPLESRDCWICGCARARSTISVAQRCSVPRAGPKVCHTCSTAGCKPDLAVSSSETDDIWTETSAKTHMDMDTRPCETDPRQGLYRILSLPFDPRHTQAC